MFVKVVVSVTENMNLKKPVKEETLKYGMKNMRKNRMLSKSVETTIASGLTKQSNKKSQILQIIEFLK
jgi:hypothetical protein